MKKELQVSQNLIIREMEAQDIIEYAFNLKPISENQKLLQRCIKCFNELTGKNLLVVLNEMK